MRFPGLRCRGSGVDERVYRSCVYCSADLGTNEVLESYPVGARVAFDPSHGRLWSICPRCWRWNLAPLAERGIPLEEAERRFRDARLRVQSENIGLARLPDGTHLVRVGKALPGELAAWRYGEVLAGRQRQYLAGATTAAVIGTALAASVSVAGGALVFGVFGYRVLLRPLWQGYRDAEVLYTHPVSGRSGVSRLHLRRKHLRWARVQPGVDGQGIDLYVPQVEEEVPGAVPGLLRTVAYRPLVIYGDAARWTMGRGLVAVNARGARRRELQLALQVLEHAGSAERYLAAAARQRLRLHGGSELIDNDPAEPNPIAALALEMALHEETERRALEGELAALEAMWREAAEIAAIADALPDQLETATE